MEQNTLPQIRRRLQSVSHGESFTQRREADEQAENRLRSANADLERRLQEITVLNEQLERASGLRRYLSTKLAESILSGEIEVDLASRRRIPGFSGRPGAL